MNLLVVLYGCQYLIGETYLFLVCLVVLYVSQTLLLQSLNIHIFSIIGVQLFVMLGRGSGVHLLSTIVVVMV
jgi:hypothetical protein